MARPRARYTAEKHGGQGHAIPPGVAAGALADQLAGATLSQTARAFGMHPSTVSRLANTLQGIDPEAVARIERGLPGLYAVLAAKFGAAASDALDRDDLANATKAMFGSKLGVEAGRLSQPKAEAPGSMMLLFVQQGLAPQPVVIPAERVADGDGEAVRAGGGPVHLPAGSFGRLAGPPRPSDAGAASRGRGEAGEDTPPAPQDRDEQVQWSGGQTTSQGQDAEGAHQDALKLEVSVIADIQAHDRA